MPLAITIQNKKDYTFLEEKGVRFTPPVVVSGNLELEPPCCITILGGFYVNGNISIGAYSYTSGSFNIGGFYSVKIGRYCSIAQNVSSYGNHPTHYFSISPVFLQQPENLPFSRNFINVKPWVDFSAETPARKGNLDINIGNDVWIGYGAFIMPGVNIGDGAVIGAKAVVTKDVPPYAIVADVPAKVIKYRFDPIIIESLLEIRWWEFAPEQLKGCKLDKIEEFIEFVKDLRKREMPYKPDIIRL